MPSSHVDVVVVGGGAAGMTAAIGLARTGFSVIVTEAAFYPGAENWSGCVYFCENLAEPDILGEEGVEDLAWERRLVERGFFMTDGRRLLGMKYRDPGAFRHCYTVLRPIYDHHLSHIARGLGVIVLSNTTVESLIRDDSRVIGVCTQRGAIYADLVFLAEGDASNLVTREGYERSADERDQPKFLQGIKQVIDMPDGAIEEAFGVPEEEGVAYEMLLRNPVFNGKQLHLNAGGFIYTNRRSLSVGLVLPLDNLRQDFAGDPNLLAEWFENLPVLKPWLGQGRPGVFGAKIIRGGGARDIPILVDEGLAIGGAASAIGIDFPYPNFTGPATAMGRLITHAACQIRAKGGTFTRAALEQHYLRPLQQSSYWQDVEFLRRWPSYVKRSTVFFDRNIDLALGSAEVWTCSNQWLAGKWLHWIRLLRSLMPADQWSAARKDLRNLSRALRLRDIAERPSLGRLLLDGAINALRDLLHQPRANLPEAGRLEMRYWAVDGRPPPGSVPGFMARWFTRCRPILAVAAQRVYRNDGESLGDKLPAVFRLLFRQLNMLDVLALAALGLLTGCSIACISVWDGLTGAWKRRRQSETELATPQLTEMAFEEKNASASWEGRLAELGYESSRRSHIQVLWPQEPVTKKSIINDSLWHVCPAHVYELRSNAMGQAHVVVNFENCIKCESCWRASNLVDWGRNGQQRLVYPVTSPAVTKLLATIEATCAKPPKASPVLEKVLPVDFRRLSLDAPATLDDRLSQLEMKLSEFDLALSEEPRTVDKCRAAHLEMLARYGQQLSVLAHEEISRQCRNLPQTDPNWLLAERTASLMLSKAQERSRRTWSERFAWAAADGRQIRMHHVPAIRQALGKTDLARGVQTIPAGYWLEAERHASSGDALSPTLSQKLEDAFPEMAWRSLEHGQRLSDDQIQALLELLGSVPSVNPDDRLGLHPIVRKRLLAEFGRRDPTVAYLAMSHLWARDMLRMAGLPVETLSAHADELLCWVDLYKDQGQASLVPAGFAQKLVLLTKSGLAVVGRTSRLSITPVVGLGLRGASLASVSLAEAGEDLKFHSVNAALLQQAWEVISSADLIAVADGMSEKLCRRALEHATSRVQFPGLFHDDQARDAIGKFGAVKKMLAQMAACHYAIETCNYSLSPMDLSDRSRTRAVTIKALVAELLGTAPGSVTYNAGQVFGGTGYSEDDILSKYYRDASAWRMLGPGNLEVWDRHGHQMLASWHDGHYSAHTLDHEAELLDELAERKALLAELDEVRNTRGRLRTVVGEWLSRHCRGSLPHAHSEEHVSANGAGETSLPDPREAAIATGLARQETRLLATKSLLLRTHARLEKGIPSEREIALVRVWLDDAADLLETFADLVNVDQRVPVVVRPIVEPGFGLPSCRYDEYLNSSREPESGDFLWKDLDLTGPRLVPELLFADPDLKGRNQIFHDTLAEYFGKKRDGLIYERYVERRHRPDDEDLAFCRRHGFFAMPVPRELGGEGRPKIDYYLLTTNSQRIADVSISLSIQANTSIGTTPVLLARDKDLPRAIEEVDSIAGKSNLHRLITTALDSTVMHVRETGHAGQSWAETKGYLADPRLSAGGVKSLLADFRAIWSKIKGDSDDPARWQAAAEAWRAVGQRALELKSELELRQKACDLFLSWVACGQISAFALTEPGAGSDTARVATRAIRRSVPLRLLDEGLYEFRCAVDGKPRTLLDARRLVFQDRRAHYRWSDQSPPAEIFFDEYDYETDRPDALRYFTRNGARTHFHDIAFIRVRAGQPCYDYWEMTGAKMWITNGRIAGLMALYAKTSEGVTGFIVDRHAEGLVVGKDEEKMGQNGSPTNELSLQAVRVPAENVLGLEGRGQVNALETLNVGRAGLAMSSVAQMQGLFDCSKRFVGRPDGSVLAAYRWRLDRIRDNQFIAEALAFEVIGRFEHPATKGVRMESAISKLMASELLHEVIELAEEIHGLPGQTQDHLVEKRKRDARILNIYEGTNEIQRFFILKDLATEIAHRWTKPSASSHSGAEALEYTALKEQLRQRVTAAVELLGQNIWQDPSLQPSCFPLAEAVAWLKAAECALGRLAWWARWDNAAAPESGTLPEDVADKIQCGKRALNRCFGETRRRLHRSDDEMARLRRGYYHSSVRAADLMYAPSSLPGPVRQACHLGQQLRVLVILEVLSIRPPHPAVVDGHLAESRLDLSASDRAALETALGLRDQCGDNLAIDVYAIGLPASAAAMREIAAHCLDSIHACILDRWRPPDRIARTVSRQLEGRRYDIVLFGGSEADREEGFIGRLVARQLGMNYAGAASDLSVSSGSGLSAILSRTDGTHHRTLPVAVAMSAGRELRDYTVSDYLGQLESVQFERWPVEPEPVKLDFVPARSRAKSESTSPDTIGSISAGEAAARALAAVGMRASATGDAGSFAGVIGDAATGSLISALNPSNKIVLILAADSTGRLGALARSVLRLGALFSTLRNRPATVLLVTPAAEQAQRRALGLIARWHFGDILILHCAPDCESDLIRGRFLASVLPRMSGMAIGEPWFEEVILDKATDPADIAVCRLTGLDIAEDGRVLLETARAEGRLKTRRLFLAADSGTAWLCIASEIDPPIPSAWRPHLAKVERWTPPADGFYRQSEIQTLLAEIKREIGSTKLSDAEFIIDVGFGVGNRDGYEVVIEPLEKALRNIGVRGLMVGGSRKVTEELHLLAPDRQIGQSGTSVGPRVLLAIGISGAPQHLNYIGDRATIIAFNRDAAAPIMVLNRTRARPRVLPVVGNLFETVPAFTAAILQECNGGNESAGSDNRNLSQSPVATAPR
jgi:alkylation response protein AidB-like acyl-CoA dehydrogenase/flavin-dependent dehydrogenase/electron transfer flavoprotein alpha subunit/ferredoxin-like protein FixX